MNGAQIPVHPDWLCEKITNTSEQKGYDDSQKLCNSEFWRGIVKALGGVPFRTGNHEEIQAPQS